MKLRHFSLSVFLLIAAQIAFGQTPGTFAPTGAMGAARTEHTATLLPSGKVLIVGGDNGAALVAQAELYDPTLGSFSATGSLNTARGQHTATLLGNGKVLIAGGIGASGELASAEIYDPDSGSFTATPDMNSDRSSHTATLLPDGRVLLAGGFEAVSGVTGSAEIYDPSANTFTTTGGMAIPRTWHTATLLQNGKVLVTGGFRVVSGSGVIEASAEIYNPSTGTFAPTVGPMTTPRALHTATLLQDGRVLITGGVELQNGYFVYKASAEIYDPASGTFSAANSMTISRALHTATLLANGNVLVVGGDTGCGPQQGCFSVTATAEVYDVTASTFNATGSMGTARDRHTATALQNDDILVAGGANTASGFLASAELYTANSSTGPKEFVIFGDHSAEPSVAADPKNPSHAVVGFNDFSSSADPVTHFGCGWAETHTGGLNWTIGSLTFPRGFHPVGDPAVKYGPDGELYFSCIGRTDYSDNGVLLLGGVKFFTAGVFIGVSKTGLAGDLGTASPIVTTLLTCPTNLGTFLAGCSIIDAGGQFDDRPSFALLNLPNGTNRIVACWTDFFSLGTNRSKFVSAAFSDDGIAWTQTTLGKGENCTVGGNGSLVAVTWFNDGDQTLRTRTSSDGINWNNAFTLANVNPLVHGTESNGQTFFSTTSLVLSEPYGNVVPGSTGLEAVWQSGNDGSEVQYGDAVANASGQAQEFTDPDNAVAPNAPTFLPGTGSCGLIAGAYQVTTSDNQFRYKVWPLSGQGPIKPSFISGVDLDRQQGDPGDPTFVGWPRFGDYTSTDCSGKTGWAVWTDTRGGKSAIYGATIPLP